MTIAIERTEDFNKISLKLDFGKKRDVIFELRGGHYATLTKGLDDRTHAKLTKVWKDFATRETLKIAAPLKFNQVQNLAMSCSDMGSFLMRFTEHNIYQMRLSLPAVTAPVPIKVKRDEVAQVEVVEGVKITKVVKKPVEVAPAVKRRQDAATAGAASSKAKKEKARAAEVATDRPSSEGTKYEYPEGMTPEEKKKFRAAARAKAKKAAG